MSSAAITFAASRVVLSLSEASPMFPIGVAARISIESFSQKPNRWVH